MVGRAMTIKTLAAAAIIASLTVPAHSQLGHKDGGGYRGPPVEEHPKIDEKAYKAALDRIPAPSQKYDPWGMTRPSEPAKSVKKDN
jgi:hypothetical protein